MTVCQRSSVHSCILSVYYYLPQGYCLWQTLLVAKSLFSGAWIFLLPTGNYISFDNTSDLVHTCITVCVSISHTWCVLAIMWCVF